MQLKTYNISFDDATYKRWKYLNRMDGITLYKFNIYDINNQQVWVYAMMESQKLLMKD